MTPLLHQLAAVLKRIAPYHDRLPATVADDATVALAAYEVWAARVAIVQCPERAAEMVLPPGKTEGGQENRHRGADQWLYVVGNRYSDREWETLLPGGRDAHAN